MKFEIEREDKFAKNLGFVSGYLLFSFILFFVLKFGKKEMPFYYVLGITFSIALIAYLLRKYVKGS